VVRNAAFFEFSDQVLWVKTPEQGHLLASPLDIKYGNFTGNVLRCEVAARRCKTLNRRLVSVNAWFGYVPNLAKCGVQVENGGTVNSLQHGKIIHVVVMELQKCRTTDNQQQVGLDLPSTAKPSVWLPWITKQRIQGKWRSPELQGGKTFRKLRHCFDEFTGRFHCNPSPIITSVNPLEILYIHSSILLIEICS
jgi:hypothetical protein